MKCPGKPFVALLCESRGKHTGAIGKCILAAWVFLPFRTSLTGMALHITDCSGEPLSGGTNARRWKCGGLQERTEKYDHAAGREV